jgi:hypothetical protein
VDIGCPSGDGETEAAAARLGREEGFEHPVANLDRDARQRH